MIGLALDQAAEIAYKNASPEGLRAVVARAVELDPVRAATVAAMIESALSEKGGSVAPRRAAEGPRP